MRDVQAQTVIDAAAVVLALGLADDPAAVGQRQRCLDLIMEGRAPSGGWGAYLTSAVEPFDTALVLLALQPLFGQPDLVAPAVDAATLREAVDRGRAFLLGGAAPRRQLGRDDPAGRAAELRSVHLHHGMGYPRAARDAVSGASQPLIEARTES